MGSSVEGARTRVNLQASFLPFLENTLERLVRPSSGRSSLGGGESCGQLDSSFLLVSRPLGPPSLFLQSSAVPITEMPLIEVRKPSSVVSDDH